jgi:hypothetical protein
VRSFAAAVAIAAGLANKRMISSRTLTFLFPGFLKFYINTPWIRESKQLTLYPSDILSQEQQQNHREVEAFLFWFLQGAPAKSVSVPSFC